MKLRADLHLHSEYSFDSRSKLKDILKIAKKNKLDIIAMTDHEEFRGAEKLAKLSRGPIIIKGEEIDTEYGDIIGLFLSEKIKTRKFSEVIAEIRKQKGLVLLPHPAVNHILINEVLKEVDLVEVFNSRAGDSQNKMGRRLSEILKKPGVSGSDAHFLFEIGNGVTVINSKSRKLEDIKNALISGRVKLECKRANKARRCWAKFVKIWRKR